MSVRTEKTAALLFRTARRIRERFYGKRVLLRGAVGLDGDFQSGGLPGEEDILKACREGYQAGLRSFAFQVPWEKKQDEDVLVSNLIRKVKAACPGCAAALAVGERSEETSHRWLEAGADRYVVRFENISREYSGFSSQPDLERQRRKYLDFLKQTGWQTGTEIEAGVFLRCPERLADELAFLRSLQPEIVKINPFIPEDNALSGGQRRDALEMTLYLMGIVRLLLPRVLLPVSGILEKAVPGGARLGLLCGANVLVMELTPAFSSHGLHPVCSAADEKLRLRRLAEAIGYEMVAERGDCYGFTRSVHPEET